jgi:hypothetical protein
MSRNKVTPINKVQSDVTLASVNEAITAWRQTRKKSNEKMPSCLWDQVFILLRTNQQTDSKILATLSLTRPQLEAETKRRKAVTSSTSSADSQSASVEALDFCEVKTIQEPSYPLAYKPAETFTTTTSVVELYRKDGALMKIHICTERFDELLRAFFNGCQ